MQRALYTSMVYTQDVQQQQCRSVGHLVTVYLVAVLANCESLGLLLRVYFNCIAEQALQHVAVYKLYVCTPCRCNILGGSQVLMITRCMKCHRKAPAYC